MTFTCNLSVFFFVAISSLLKKKEDYFLFYSIMGIFAILSWVIFLVFFKLKPEKADKKDDIDSPVEGKSLLEHRDSMIDE